MANRAPKQLSLPHILWEVFRRPGYIILILVVILGILVFAAWLPNLHFLGQTLFTGRYSVGARAIILLNTFNLLQSNLSVVTLSLTVLIAFLTAVNIALIVYYFRQNKPLKAAAGTGFFGLLVGLFGIGCATCGSVVLSAIFGLTATAAFVSYLPWRGLEFGLFSLVVLTLSLFLTARKIKEPSTCRVKPTAR